MKAKLIINGKELEVEISEEQFQKLKPKTGYERVGYGEKYWTIYSADVDGWYPEMFNKRCQSIYDNANYYSDKTVAKNNARADLLMHKLRRFAVEHRKNKLDWSDEDSYKHYIYYNYRDKELETCMSTVCRDYGQIYFDSEEAAKLAIDTFKDELLWYFTEYKDSL